MVCGILMYHSPNFVVNHLTQHTIDSEILSIICYGGCRVGSSSIHNSLVL